MELEQVFYTLAALFGVAAVVYFAWEYLYILPRITKSFLLLGISAVIFLIAGILRGVDK